MDPAERRALLILLSLAVVGHGVRWLVTRPGDAPGEVELLATLPPRSARAHLDSAQALTRPLAPGERIDLDRASAAEIARLPKIGPRLARTIVADREAKGPFGSLEGFDRVPGVGPGLIAAVRDHVRFSGQPAAAAPGPPVPATLPAAAGSWLPGGSPGLSEAPSGRPKAPPAAPPGRLNLNTATAAQLEGLPGIGPSRAAAIVRFRTERGGFRSVDELDQVPGISKRHIEKFRERVFTH